jgi:hypothetical protein
MATQPDPSPDIIEPGSPPEVTPQPLETPSYSPDEVPEVGPDIDEPGRGPDEAPTPL